MTNKNLNNKGLIGDVLVEQIPQFRKRSGDIEIKNENNAWIILGRDRPGNIASGFGGHPPPLGSNAGAIDLVVGRMGNKPEKDVYVENDFLNDSARIYISQKTDIDKNFKISGGQQSTQRSGIGIKADSVRVIGREGIKLVTGTVSGEKNSLGESALRVYGIDLIAGNFEDQEAIDSESLYGAKNIQPMVKGNNLVKALEDLTDKIHNLSGIVSTFLSSQMDYNATVALHYHYSPFYAIPCTPSDTVAMKGMETSMKQLKDCVLGLTQLKINLTSFKVNYLQPPSSTYINSKFNRTN